MLLKHSGLYAVGRGLPAFVALLAIVAFSRLLTPEAYGQYALVLASVGLLSAVLFQWLRLCVLRFLPAEDGDPARLLSPILGAFLALVVLTAVGGGSAVVFVSEQVWRRLVAVGLALICAQAWFELNGELARSRLAPIRYGLLSSTKAAVALVLGVLLVMAGLGAFGALLGLLGGLLLAPALFSRAEWRGVRPARFRLDRHRDLLAYGLPLALNVILLWVVASSDRLLLAWFLDVNAAGLYAVGYDLGQYSIGVVLAIVNLAAYPLVVRALEREGVEAARNQLRGNVTLLLGVALPASAALVLLAPRIASVFVGAEFRSTAAALIPWIALAALMAGIKAFHFDLAFQLGRRTIGQVWVSLAAAAVNLALNFLWIPRFGLLGAAYATLMAYAVALAGSVCLGRLAFPVPWEWRGASRVAAATALMVGALWLGVDLVGDGAVGLALSVLLGAGAYVVAAIGLDIGGLREPARTWLRRAWAAG